MTDLEQRFRDLKRRFSSRQPILGPSKQFVIDCLRLNPYLSSDTVDEIVDLWFVGPRLFALTRSAAVFSPSWKWCFDPPSASEWLATKCRALVRPQIEQHKHRFFATWGSPCSCEFTGKIIHVNQCHVDHVAPNTFHQLLILFRESRQLSVEQIKPNRGFDQGYRPFVDMSIADAWRDFHATHASLRVVSAEANLGELKKRSSCDLRESILQVLRAFPDGNTATAICKAAGLRMDFQTRGLFDTLVKENLISPTQIKKSRGPSHPGYILNLEGQL